MVDFFHNGAKPMESLAGVARVNMTTCMHFEHLDSQTPRGTNDLPESCWGYTGKGFYPVSYVSDCFAGWFSHCSCHSVFVACVPHLRHQ